MSTYRPAVGATDEWYTPPEIFEALDLVFDLDPCSPGLGHWVPARQIYTKADNGLELPWHNVVFMNPPFGGRNGQVPWLRKFFAHGNGIGIVIARTSAGWFHDWMPRAEVIVLPRGKTKFVKPDGTVGKAPHDGVAIFSVGEIGNAALKQCRLGLCTTVFR